MLWFMLPVSCPKVDPAEYSFHKDRQIVEVNVLGAMAWLNLAAERFYEAA